MRDASASSSAKFLSAPSNGAGILLQGLCTLIAIALVHSGNRLSCVITLTLFATGIALSILLIAAYSRPFTGEISVKPELLKQVIASETAAEPRR
jgi:multisubunit Na+/H+ antiporter MnhC subunit